MKKSFSTPLILFLFFSSCSKDWDVNFDIGNWNIDWKTIPAESHFDSVGLKYMKIPLKREYLYKDSSTGKIETVKVTRSDTVAIFQKATVGTQAYVDNYYDTYTLAMTRMVNNTPTTTWYSGVSTCNFNSSSYIILYDSQFELANETDKVAAFWYPFQNNPLQEYSLLPNYVVAGISYSEVHLFHASNGISPSDPAFMESWYYWVKGIGIIKRRIQSATGVKTDLLISYR